MKLTYTEIKRILGSKDRDSSELTLSLVIKYPTLSAKDIFSIFETTMEKYLSKEDYIEDEIAWTNRVYGGKTMLQIQQEKIDPKINRHSTYIFKNFYRVIDETEEWSKQVKSKTLASLFEKFRKSLVAQLKKNYRNTVLQDKFEITCEFIDLLDKKRSAES